MTTPITKLNKEISQSMIDDLMQYQSSLVYDPFVGPSGDMDGNSISLILDNSSLPQSILDAFAYELSIGDGCNFLKNNGIVIMHKDVRRQCSITIPLSNISIGTTFYDDNIGPILTQLHELGSVYLQNNQVFHAVNDHSETERIFFQIRFRDKTYDEVLALLTK